MTLIVAGALSPPDLSNKTCHNLGKRMGPKASDKSAFKSNTYSHHPAVLRSDVGVNPPFFDKTFGCQPLGLDPRGMF